MFKSVRGRMITILVISAVCVWQLWSQGLKLGLDLQGGMHLALEVADPEGTLTPEARADAIARSERTLRTRIDELGVEEPLIQVAGDDRLIVELAGLNDRERARDIVQQAAYLEFKLVQPVAEVTPALPRLDRIVVNRLGPDSVRALVGGAAEVGAPGNEIEDLLFGGDTATGEDTTVAATEDTAAAAQDTAAPAPTEAELRPLTALLNQGNREGSFLVATEDVPAVETFLAMPEVQQAMPRGVELHWGEQTIAGGARTYREVYVLQDEAFMDGSELEDAVAGRDPMTNEPQVNFELSRVGGRSFSRFTGANVGEFLAIVLDDQVISAPVIQSQIGARGVINMGGGTLEEAADLALVLRAGALPAPLQIMEERTVGPSLGQDSIDQGRMAGIVGIILVLGVMIAYYRMAGVLAIGALTVYVLLVLGGLAGLNATLTLPGIAGLILSVGMAVDANVLIFERIREELDAGRATRTAVDSGFDHALSAIVDANLTTLITALILFQFGTGPVRGFAVTLSIGIVASFFSALYVTRTFFLVYLQGRKASDPISI